MANPEKKKNLTRKQHSRLEREQTLRKYTLISVISIVAIVVIIILAGFVLEGIVKPNQPVAQVGDTAITTGDFQAYARYQRFRLVNEYLSTFQFVQSMGDPNSLAYFESYLLQIQNELEPEALGLNVINQMVDDAIIAQEAEKLGIEVSEEEVKQRVQEAIFQYYPKGSPTPAPTSPVYPTPTLSALQMTLVPPTPTAVITMTPGLTTTGVLTGTTAEENTEAQAVTATPTLAPTAIPPTPTAYTEKSFNNDYDDYISYLRSYARVSEKNIFDFFKRIVLREKITEVVITDLPLEEEKLWARHILFRDPDTGKAQAEAFLERVKAGEDFVAVADELSAAAPVDEATMESNVIFENLGWFGEGTMVETFEMAAKELEIGEISEVVETDFGWHVIQLLGRDVQPRSQYNLDQLQAQAFETWLGGKRQEYTVDISPDWITVVPLEPEIPEQARITPADAE